MPKAAKGSVFERALAREISLWWSGGKAEDWFWRVGGSGGRATARAKVGKSTENGYGDIVGTHPMSIPLTQIMVFEAKRGYNAASFQDLLDKPEGPGVVRGFLEQTQKATDLARAAYFGLIWQRDRRKPIICHNLPSQLISATSYTGMRYLGFQIEPLADFFRRGAYRIHLKEATSQTWP